MKDIDDSDEAVAFVTEKARKLQKLCPGKSRDELAEMAVQAWERSLLRAQLISQMEWRLLKEGKPTLRVGLFEAAKFSKSQK